MDAKPFAAIAKVEIFAAEDENHKSWWLSSMTKSMRDMIGVVIVGVAGRSFLVCSYRFFCC